MTGIGAVDVAATVSAGGVAPGRLVTAPLYAPPLMDIAWQDEYGRVACEMNGRVEHAL